MKYALNLDGSGRILSITYEKYGAPGQPIVDSLPDGDYNNYLYINGDYVFNPLPPEPEPEPEINSDDILNVLLGVEG